MRNFDGNRFGLGSAQLCECFGDRLRHVFGALGPALPFRDRRQNAGLIAHFMQQAEASADGAGEYVSCNAEHAGIAGIGCRQARHRVEDTRPRHDKADTDFSARAGIAVGHIGGRLLVARADKPDLVRDLAQPVDGPIELNAGYGKDDLDALPHQLAGEGISSCLTSHRELPRKFDPLHSLVRVRRI